MNGTVNAGTKFFVSVEPGMPGVEDRLHHIYELYVDFVLKNPFYELEMPIRCELFDLHLANAIRSARSVGRADKL